MLVLFRLCSGSHIGQTLWAWLLAFPEDTTSQQIAYTTCSYNISVPFPNNPWDLRVEVVLQLSWPVLTTLKFDRFGIFYNGLHAL